MDYKTVLEQLKNYRRIMDESAIDTNEFHEAGQAYDKLLYGNGLTMRGYLFVAKNVTRDLTVEDDANIIVAQAQGRPLSDVVPFTTEAEFAYLLKWHRQQAKLTQTEVAKAVGMTQAQIARIENAENETTVSRFKKLMDVVGGKMTVA